MQRFIIDLDLPPGTTDKQVGEQLHFSRKSGIRLLRVEPFTPPAPKPAPAAGLVKRFRIHVKSASSGDRDYLVFGVNAEHARSELQKTGYNGRIASITED